MLCLHMFIYSVLVFISDFISHSPSMYTYGEVGLNWDRGCFSCFSDMGCAGDEAGAGAGAGSAFLFFGFSVMAWAGLGTV